MTRNVSHLVTALPPRSKFSQSLARRIDNAASPVTVSGCDSVLGAALLILDRVHHQRSDRPVLAVVKDEDTAQSLVAALAFWDPTTRALTLPALDVSPYSGLYPKESLSPRRVGWAHAAQAARSGQVFVAPIQALVQRTLPFAELAQNTLRLSPRDRLPPDFKERLIRLGYRAVPMVEDYGTFAWRGGIVDIFSPTHDRPVRMELFADQIESLRFFDSETQISTEECLDGSITPARESILSDEARAQVLQSLSGVVDKLPENYRALLQVLQHNQFAPELDLLAPLMFKSAPSPLEHFSTPIDIFMVDSVECVRAADVFNEELKTEGDRLGLTASTWGSLRFLVDHESLQWPEGSSRVLMNRLRMDEPTETEGLGDLAYPTEATTDFQRKAVSLLREPHALAQHLRERIGTWRSLGYAVGVCAPSETTRKRLKILLEEAGFEVFSPTAESRDWEELLAAQRQVERQVALLPWETPESVRLTQEKIVILRESDFYGVREKRRAYKTTGSLAERTNALSFGDLKPGELVVHTLHGVGVYEGLKLMPIQGVPSEFIQIQYKDADRLYLPVYRVGQIKKFSGPQGAGSVDKLGGTGWLKTKTRVRSALRDLAAELLRLYASRSVAERPPFGPPDADYDAFERGFPFEETPDQARAIESVLSDLQRPQPMDRLICGDVGFGKTEVALRAAFKVVQEKRQVAVVAPTTILTFQHAETFKKRFKDWPIQIRALNRFVSSAEARKTLSLLREGAVDIVIGTHRLFSKDVQFKNLGLLIVDEEQKFGVKHKENLRRLKMSVDTMAMSATPIPRTLNLSLVGIRDLSLINTAPVDRMPTRTFVCRFDPEVIRRAIRSELDRGGQVFFLHNRIHSIYALFDELRSLLPDVRMAVAHGQMQEDDLEQTMLRFLNHEVDVLLSTAIIESGIDIPNANLMIIDNAHQLGLSQLYQLRGRVGRSKRRAYCYLLLPKNANIDKQAQERLRVIQENTALGSGIQIAQHDLELRGAGDILGEDQSGYLNAVGYETYIELLEQAVREAKGEDLTEQIDPEINVRIPALIPDSYMPDVRMRLSYYKLLTEITGADDLDRIESELRDQFGKPPEPVINLMGLMLIRKVCKDLGIRDVSSGSKSISLSFTDRTHLSPQAVVKLVARENKKYSLTPDQRLNVRINEISWPRILEELEYLGTLSKSP